MKDLTIPKKFASEYIKFLTAKKNKLSSQLQQLQKELSELDNHINSISNYPIFKESQDMSIEIKDYNPSLPWTRKVSIYGNKKVKLMNSNEVVNFILENEPNLDKEKVRSSISAVLSNRVKSETYLKHTDPASEITYYGLKDWFDDFGEPKREYLPDELK